MMAMELQLSVGTDHLQFRFWFCWVNGSNVNDRRDLHKFVSIITVYLWCHDYIMSFMLHTGPHDYQKGKTQTALLMINQISIDSGKWLGVVMQEAIAWGNAVPTPVNKPLTGPMLSMSHRSGSCLTTAIWRCRKNSSQCQRSFQWKLRTHWLKFLLHRHVTIVKQGPMSPCGVPKAPWVN